jgi:choline dehydrogenase-like flavoprotein
MLADTDYLVVGAGATGLAFADALAASADAEVTVVDRDRAPGGHWLHAYPFVRLHTPSAYYGVDSLALGDDRIDQAGENAGYYERATGSEVREYFAEAAGVDPGHPRSPVRGGTGRTCHTCQRPAAGGRIGFLLCRAGGRQDGCERLYLASGQRRTLSFRQWSQIGLRCRRAEPGPRCSRAAR